jgi:hypothetical protein
MKKSRRKTELLNVAEAVNLLLIEEFPVIQEEIK